MRFAWIPLILVLDLQLLPMPLARAGDVPQEGWVVWASTREDGRHEIYRARADGNELLRLTKNGGQLPTWSPDGSWVSYIKEEEEEVWLVRPDGSEDHKIADGLARFWVYNGGALMVQHGEQLYKVDPATGQQTPFVAKADFARIKSSSVEKFTASGLTADERFLVVSTDFYESGAEGDNGTFKHGWGPQVLDLQNKDKLYFIGEGCEGTLTPSSNTIFHVNAGNYPDTRFYRMDLKDLESRSSYKLEFDTANEDWGHEYFPRVSTDGQWMVYGATDWDAAGDEKCHDHDTCDYEIFIRRVGAQGRQRLTESPSNDQWPHLYVGPLWDPQGPPRISLSHSSIDFSADDPDATPGERTVTISNPGGGTLALVETAIQYTGARSGWLTVEVKGEENALTLVNRVALAGLPSGSHGATVTVTSPEAPDGAQNYQVTLSLEGSGVPVDPARGDPTDPASPPLGLEARLVGGCAVTAEGPGGQGLLPLLLGLLVLSRRRRTLP